MFLTRRRTETDKSEPLTKSWFTIWGSRGTTANSSHVTAIPGNLENLLIYFQTLAYIELRRNDELWHIFKQTVYAIHRHLTREGNAELRMRIVTLKPAIASFVV